MELKLQETQQAYFEVSKAIQAINTHREHANLAGLPDFMDEEGDPIDHNEYKAFAEKLRELAKECEELDTHVHDWNSDDYCIHCGADGRA